MHGPMCLILFDVYQTAEYDESLSQAGSLEGKTTKFQNFLGITKGQMNIKMLPTHVDFYLHSFIFLPFRLQFYFNKVLYDKNIFLESVCA